MDDVDVTVIGTGQAGLSTAHHLALRGLDTDTHVRVVDAEDGPGGAWRHRWPTLTMDRVNGIFELPGQQRDEVAGEVPASEAMPRWFAAYERRQGIVVHRPVVVDRVEEAGDGRLAVHTDAGRWRTRALVNATGTWRRPHWPHVPGRERFTGLQLHTHDYPGPQPFAGQRIVVVGGGSRASAT